MTKTELKKGILAEFEEKGAEIEHARWGRWQNYLHSLCIKNADGSLTIPSEKADHWNRQIHTTYFQLSEGKKEMDRKEVREYLPFLSSALDTAIETAFRETEVEKVPTDYPDDDEGRQASHENRLYNAALASKSAKEVEFINS